MHIGTYTYARFPWDTYLPTLPLSLSLLLPLSHTHSPYYLHLCVFYAAQFSVHIGMVYGFVCVYVYVALTLNFISYVKISTVVRGRNPPNKSFCQM